MTGKRENKGVVFVPPERDPDHPDHAKFKAGTIDALADEFAANMPAVEEHVKSELEQRSEDNHIDGGHYSGPGGNDSPPPPPPSPYAHIRDRHGRAFDPAIHETNPDGSPVIIARGRCKIRRIGPKAIKQTSSHSHPSQTGAGEGQTPSSAPSPGQEQKENLQGLFQDGHFLAGMVCGMMESAAVTLLGKDMALSSDERKTLVGTWEMYLNQFSDLQLSPGWVVTLTTLQIFGIKAAMSDTARERLSLIHAKLSGKAAKKDSHTTNNDTSPDPSETTTTPLNNAPESAPLEPHGDDGSGFSFSDRGAYPSYFDAA